MKLTKKIIVGACSITGALAVIGSLTSCGDIVPQYTITFVGKNYTNAGKSYKFKANQKLTYQVGADKGFSSPKNISCKFNDTEKVKGRDYTYDGTSLIIPQSPAGNITVTISPVLNVYKANFLSEDSKTYTVTSSKKQFHYGEKELVYDFTDNSGAGGIFPESIHVYFNGIEKTPKEGNYTYTNKPTSNDGEFTQSARLTLHEAPDCDITVSLQDASKHVIYFKCVGATIKGEYEGHGTIDAGNTAQFKVVADTLSTLPEKSEIEVYKGGVRTTDFDYELNVEKDIATIKINNVNQYIAVYVNANTEMFTYEYDQISDGYHITGFNSEYAGSKTDVRFPDTYKNKNVISIKDGAFKGKTEIEKISYFGENIATIGTSAFEGCTSLKDSAEIKATEIKTNAFKGCIALTEFTDANLQIIGSNAFEGCTSMHLGSLMLNLREIGDYAFKNCTSMSTASDEKGYITSPLVISSGTSGYGFDITKLGEGVCEGWKTNESGEEQIIIFAGDNKNAKDLEAYGYKTTPIKDEEAKDTGYYKEINGGTKTLGGKDLGNITIAFTDLNLFSWSEIARISERGYAKYIWNVGDTRLNENVSKVQYRIIGFDHDDRVNGYGKAGITFETVKLGFIEGVEQVQFTKTWPASYTNSLIKDKFNIDFMKSDELKAGNLSSYITPVVKKCILDKDHPDELVKVEPQFLFPLSYVEIGGEVETYQQYKLEGSTYEYYKNSTEETRKKMRQKYEQSSSFILRSPYLISQSYNNKYMIGIDLNGKFFPFNATQTPGWAYSYAFCI